MPHLRPPSIDHGVVSFLWALFLGLVIWLGGSFIGFPGGITFVFGLVAAFLIFVWVRTYGEDAPPRP